MACVVAFVSLAAFSTVTQLFLINRIAAFEGYSLDHSVAYGTMPEQQLDVYLPMGASQEKRPVVVFFYGGCWGACTTYRKEQYAFVAEAFTSHNMIAVIVDYRLYPDVMFPDMIADASRAVEWVHKNIAAYGGAADNIFLVGHSAGGHLAAMLTMDKKLLTRETYAGLKGFVGLAGAYNFLPFDEDYMPRLFGPPMQALDSQPVHFVDGTEPASLLLYGADDTRVKRKNIDGLQDSLLAVGSSVQVKIYDGVDHGSIVAAFSVLLRDSKPVFADVLAFIQAQATSGEAVAAP